MGKLIGLIALGILLTPVLAGAHSGEDGSAHHSMMEGFGMWGNMGGLWSWLWALLYIVWLIAGILLAIWLWRQLTKKQ